MDDKRLIIECDELSHEGTRILAVLQRYSEAGRYAELDEIWWHFPQLVPRDQCGSSDYPLEDVVPGALTYFDLVGTEVISTSDHREYTKFHVSDVDLSYYRALADRGEGNSRDRFKIQCPQCRGFDVCLNVTRVYPDTNQIMVCPVLDKFVDAGMERVSLRLLSHAVSYGIK